VTSPYRDADSLDKQIATVTRLGKVLVGE